MDCPICTAGKGIPVDHVEKHLTSERHGIYPKDCQTYRLSE